MFLCFTHKVFTKDLFVEFGHMGIWPAMGNLRILNELKRIEIASMKTVGKPLRGEIAYAPAILARKVQSKHGMPQPPTLC